MEGRRALWVVAAPLLAFKVWASILLLVNSPTGESALSLLMVYGWPWIIAFAVLVAGPTLAWSRLVRVRARRKSLQRSEWMTDLPPSRSSTASNASVDPTQWPLWDPVSRGDRES